MLQQASSLSKSSMGPSVCPARPFYWRVEEDGRHAYGFPSDHRHGNPNGALHGAAILTFVDWILGHASGFCHWRKVSHRRTYFAVRCRCSDRRLDFWPRGYSTINKDAGVSGR